MNNKIDHNNETLNAFIEFNKQNFRYDAFIICDLNHECLYASDILVEYIGERDITGRKVADISEEYNIFSKEFREKVTIKVLESGKPYISFFLLKNKLSNDFGIHQAYTYPILDKNQNLIAYCTRSSQLGFNEAIFNMLKNISFTQNNDNHINIDIFTERERAIVFLLIVGLSHKEIAPILSEVYGESISVSSVTTMINRQIYPKFDTNVSSVLIQKAICNGLFYNIPIKLIHKMPKVFFAEDYTKYCEKNGLIL